MPEEQKQTYAREPGRASTLYTTVTSGVALAAIAVAFILSNLGAGFAARAAGFSACRALYRGSVILYLRQGRAGQIQDGKTNLETRLETGLDALDEAGKYFSGSLRLADAFRLVSSRVRDILPYETLILFLLDESRMHLTPVHADGLIAVEDKGGLADFDTALPGQAFKSRTVEIDGYLSLDDNQRCSSSAAIPLKHGENVFGVLQLMFGDSYRILETDPSLFEAVGVRAEPLILGAVAFERTQANALTDATTELPNERAFYLVLENQAAETARRRCERPLTILAIDIANFEEVNCTFGHAAGDRVLNFAAKSIKDSVRQMDFVARALGDEFLVILPTADKRISDEIVTRIRAAFFGERCPINDSQAIEIELNIGWAEFGVDGETPGQLLSHAQLRKEQSKPITASNVLWFPNDVGVTIH